VDKLQRLLGAVRSLLRERPAAHLGADAGVVDLRRVLDHRNASGHLLLAEPMESVEVQMSKPLMPAPGIVVLPRGETNRLHGVEMKNVKAVAAALYLSEEALALIPDTQDAVLDLHLRARFIELTQGHDGVAKRRDEIDAVESSFFAWNTTEPTPWISTHDALPNFTVPRTVVSSSEKISRRPDMWWVAPLSRYQPSSLSSSLASPRKTRARGSAKSRNATALV